MSLRALQKSVGADASAPSQESKSVTQPQSRSNGGGRGGGRGGGGYYDRGGGSSGGYYSAGQGATAPPKEQAAGQAWTPAAGGIAYPAPSGGFRGSSAQSKHVEAMKKATAEASSQGGAYKDSTEVAVRSGLGLEALRERKLKEEMEKQAKREAARARRLNEETKKDMADIQQLLECEQQARQDVESANDDARPLKYEAALIVRIALTFGAGAVWTKIAEARARGAEIPLDPRRVYVLAHPDKCPLPEASDATAILNAQRPPEMIEARARGPASMPTSSAASKELDPASAAREARMEARRRKAAGEEVPRPPAAPAAASEPVVAPSVSSTAAPASQAPAAAERVAEASPSAAFVAEEQVQPASVGDSVPFADDVERRVDPEDGASCSLEELRKKYANLYTPEDIEAYWRDDCKPLPNAKPKPKAKSRRF